MTARCFMADEVCEVCGPSALRLLTSAMCGRALAADIATGITRLCDRSTAPSSKLTHSHSNTTSRDNKTLLQFFHLQFFLASFFLAHVFRLNIVRQLGREYVLRAENHRCCIHQCCCSRDCWLEVCAAARAECGDRQRWPSSTCSKPDGQKKMYVFLILPSSPL